MGLLNRFFHSPERSTQDIVADEAILLQMWNNYIASTKEKADLHRIFATDRQEKLAEADIVDLRERFQYGLHRALLKHCFAVC